MNVPTVGVLVGLLLPAVQSAREAARRMSASNNLKQIALAIHNYYDAHQHFPPRAILDDDGKPLLSWRVAILPFVEQQALYERFHLDEPWDSPHNLPLADLMPEVYVDPSAAFLGNLTMFQSPAGEDTAFGAVGTKRGFRDILDGTSNTIMVVETHMDQAVVWSQPADVEIPDDDPISVLGHIHPGGFHVSMCDGSVQFITHQIETTLLKALLTADGGEVITNP